MYLSASAVRARGLVVVLNPIRASFLLWLQSSPSNKDIRLRGAGLLPTPHTPLLPTTSSASVHVVYYVHLM